MNDDFHYRFSGIERLYSKEGLKRLSESHVCVIGIGGVGSWSVEALARSGIGKITMVDLDEVCVSNVNRQLHALDGQIGKQKIDAMAERIQAINPSCEINALSKFYTEKTADVILDYKYDYVLDAIDNARHKAHLIAKCREKGLPVITVGGAGGRRDPNSIEIKDLSRSYNDSLLQFVRKQLRQKYNFPRQRRWKFKVDCVFSPEDPYFPQSDGTVCKTKEEGSDTKLDCESGYGTATFITGIFGFMAASKIVEKIAMNNENK